MRISWMPGGCSANSAWGRQSGSVSKQIGLLLQQAGMWLVPLWRQLARIGWRAEHGVLSRPCFSRTCAARTTPYTAAPPTVARPESADSTRWPATPMDGMLAGEQRQSTSSASPAPVVQAHFGPVHTRPTAHPTIPSRSPTPPVMNSMVLFSLFFMTGRMVLANTKWLPAKLAMTRLNSS